MKANLEGYQPDLEPSSPRSGSISVMDRERDATSPKAHDNLRNRSSDREGQSTQNQQQSANLYKTELCRSFSENGNCRYGNKCQFAHGLEELRPVARHKKYKTEKCKNYDRDGFCPYGSRCRFIHNEGTDFWVNPQARISNLLPSPKSPPKEIEREGLIEYEGEREDSRSNSSISGDSSSDESLCSRRLPIFQRFTTLENPGS